MEREEKLVKQLIQRLDKFVSGSREEFVEWAKLEKARLEDAGELTDRHGTDFPLLSGLGFSFELLPSILAGATGKISSEHLPSKSPHSVVNFFSMDVVRC